MKSMKGVVLAMLSSGTFGMIALFSLPLMKQGLHIETILFYRFFVAAIAMGIFCLIRKQSFKVSKNHLLPLMMLSVFYAATSLLLICSYQWIPSGIATTIHFLYPVIVGILMVLFFKEKGSSVLFMTALLSLIGVVLLCWSDTANMAAMGIITATLTIFTYSFYIVGVNQTKTGREMGAQVLTFYVLFFSAIMFYIYGSLTTGIQPIQGASQWGNLLGLGVLSTVISNLALVLAIKYIGSTITSILGSMEPLVAMSIGVLYFSETFTTYTLLGVVLIITAVSLVVRETARPKKVGSGKLKVEN